MPSPAVNVGTGTTADWTVGGDVFDDIAASTTHFDITDVSWSGITRPEIETTHMNLAAPAGGLLFGTRTYMPGDIVNCGEITLEGHLNPDLLIPIEAATGVLVIVFAGAGSWTTVGAMLTNFDFTVPLEDKMGFTATFQVTGDVLIAAG